MRIEAANSQLKDCESVIKRIKAGDGNTALLLPNLNTPVNEEDAVDHQTANNANDLVYEGLLLDLNVPPPMENVANNGNQNVDNEDQMLQLANDIDVNDDIGNDHNDNVDNQLANDNDVNDDIEGHVLQLGNDHNDNVDNQLANDNDVNDDIEGHVLQLGNDHNDNVDNQLANDNDVNDDIEGHVLQLGNDHNDNVDNQADDSQDDMPPLEDAE
ncbi:unnamed protein product [Linum tenue]|uniref:Uncharacterized protein n=1 Tax=Linum tenue TaxID=586396 RepID=A0AAV0S7V8_9ROSI|nr:unnamed protein product [Linum tenue]